MSSSEERMGLMAQFIDSIRAINDYKKNSKDFIFYKLFMIEKYKARVSKLIRSLYKREYIMSRDDLLELFEYIYPEREFRKEFNPYSMSIKYNTTHELYSVTIDVDHRTTADILLYKNENTFALTVQAQLDTGALSSWNITLNELSSNKPINSKDIKAINTIFNEIRAQFLEYTYDSMMYNNT